MRTKGTLPLKHRLRALPRAMGASESLARASGQSYDRHECEAKARAHCSATVGYAQEHGDHQGRRQGEKHDCGTNALERRIIGSRGDSVGARTYAGRHSFEDTPKNQF